MSRNAITLELVCSFIQCKEGAKHEDIRIENFVSNYHNLKYLANLFFLFANKYSIYEKKD